jgi:hypothetical protein
MGESSGGSGVEQHTNQGKFHFNQSIRILEGETLSPAGEFQPSHNT